MATTNSHTPRVPSIPTTLAEAHARIRQLGDENRRLRFTLHGIERQVESLEPGKYILTGGCDFNGPYSGDIDKVVRSFAEDGETSTIVTVTSRYAGKTEPEDFGVIAGVDYTLTLSPAACW